MSKDLNTLFYSIWINKYIRKQIRNHVFRNKRIIVSLDYIDNNQQYLSLLSDDDKITYNIDICLDIDRNNIQQYRNNKYKHIVNHLYCKEYMDLDTLPHHGVHSLSLSIDDNFKGSNDAKLPDSIRILFIYCSRTNITRFTDIIDRFIYSLPCNLRILDLTKEFAFTKQCILPATLEQFYYVGNSDSFSHIVVSSTKLIGNCTLVVNSMKDIQWLNDGGDKTWISKIQISVSINITRGLLPNYIKYLSIQSNDVVFDNDALLLDSLESIRCYNDFIINRGMLPAGLKTLFHQNFNQPIEPGLLPDSLKTLVLERIVGRLKHGSLPSNLTRLEISNYNHVLQPGILPETLQQLSIGEYCRRLNQHCLPTSLICLELPNFFGSFSSVSPLKLGYLKVLDLHPSVSTLFQNVNEVYIEFQSLDSFDNISLYNTCIESLYLLYTNDGGKELELPINFFPPSLRKLELHNLHIKSAGVINDGCVSIISDIDIDDSYIPTSVNKISNKLTYSE